MLSLTIIAVAVVVLYHILREIDPDELIDAIEATNWRTFLIAGLLRLTPPGGAPLTRAALNAGRGSSVRPLLTWRHL